MRRMIRLVAMSGVLATAAASYAATPESAACKCDDSPCTLIQLGPSERFDLTDVTVAGRCASSSSCGAAKITLTAGDTTRAIYVTPLHGSSSGGSFGQSYATPIRFIGSSIVAVCDPGTADYVITVSG